ncbi:hypothetical protein BOTBODRAFT_29325 [Botryobasidium botryosum FD-172 SS1]|uniref:Uncharacterized protein n=1 Tax=Botryobasidium botryosum (strain FD-172 SS1) TaxID=930990 RepID=A0A067N1I1_BOTB1|nr:hypothetical protein BOTBODRAFT_29325 [Botryobasidium botryosum FD-172 SS1]
MRFLFVLGTALFLLVTLVEPAQAWFFPIGLSFVRPVYFWCLSWRFPWLRWCSAGGGGGGGNTSPPPLTCDANHYPYNGVCEERVRGLNCAAPNTLWADSNGICQCSTAAPSSTQSACNGPTTAGTGRASCVVSGNNPFSSTCKIQCNNGYTLSQSGTDCVRSSVSVADCASNPSTPDVALIIGIGCDCVDASSYNSGTSVLCEQPGPPNQFGETKCDNAQLRCVTTCTSGAAPFGGRLCPP